jgi:hypothetical protein
MTGGNIETNLLSMNSNTSHRHIGGGGVYVAADGEFFLKGGTIKNNRVLPPPAYQTGGGGVFVAAKGEMEMTGGLITENRVQGGNSQAWRGGGGIHTAGKVYMRGGTIHENISETEGGGVFVGENGEFHMYKGEITGNHALSTTVHGGGGVMITGGTFITYNTSKDGEKDKIIRGNRAAVNGGGIVVRARFTGDFDGPGLLEIVDGTVISGNFASSNTTVTKDRSVGGGILLTGQATLNLYGGEIFDNNAGHCKGLTWVNGTINLKGSPRVGGGEHPLPDHIRRYDTDPIYNVNYTMNIIEPLRSNTLINIRDDTRDRGSPDFAEPLTVIARRTDGGAATDTEAGYFHYMGTGNPRSTWNVIPRVPNKNSDYILGRPTKFALLSVPNHIHFGTRALLTTNLVGPYGDATLASNVTTDFTSGINNWLYGFEVVNTRHDGWSVTLRATPFVNDDGIVGAIPIAVGNSAGNQTQTDLTMTSAKIFSSNKKDESIKWHWTQMQYKIEAQTNLATVVPDNYKSVFTWYLHDVP